LGGGALSSIGFLTAWRWVRRIDVDPSSSIGILTIKIVQNPQEKTSTNWKIKKLNEVFQILRLS